MSWTSQISRNMHVWPLTREIAHASTRLDLRADPADQVIAATSVVHAIWLVTRDKAILRPARVPFPRWPA